MISRGISNLISLGNLSRAILLAAAVQYDYEGENGDPSDNRNSHTTPKGILFLFVSRWLFSSSIFVELWWERWQSLQVLAVVLVNVTTRSIGETFDRTHSIYSRLAVVSLQKAKSATAARLAIMPTVAHKSVTELAESLRATEQHILVNGQAVWVHNFLQLVHSVLN